MGQRRASRKQAGTGNQRHNSLNSILWWWWWWSWWWWHTHYL